MVELQGQSNGSESRRRGKSATAYRTIGEAAVGLDLPQHVLRFWETKFPQLSPVKRKGGRRYYRPEDLALLRQIRKLLYQDGYTIKGVQKLFKDSSNLTSGDASSSDQGADQQAPAKTATGGLLDLRKQAELEVIYGELREMRTLLD